MEHAPTRTIWSVAFRVFFSRLNARVILSVQACIFKKACNFQVHKPLSERAFKSIIKELKRAISEHSTHISEYSMPILAHTCDLCHHPSIPV